MAGLLAIQHVDSPPRAASLMSLRPRQRYKRSSLLGGYLSVDPYKHGFTSPSTYTEAPLGLSSRAAPGSWRSADLLGLRLVRPESSGSLAYTAGWSGDRSGGPPRPRPADSPGALAHPRPVLQYSTARRGILPTSWSGERTVPEQGTRLEAPRNGRARTRGGASRTPAAAPERTAETRAPTVLDHGKRRVTYTSEGCQRRCCRRRHRRGRGMGEDACHFLIAGAIPLVLCIAACPRGRIS